MPTKALKILSALSYRFFRTRVNLRHCLGKGQAGLIAALCHLPDNRPR